MRTLKLIFNFLAIFGSPDFARAVIIGLPADTLGNCFPFGCVGTGPSTRYQQVYASSQFASSINIGQINFFQTHQNGNLNSGVYTLSLSTTSVAVNALSTSNFDSNRGANNTLFTVAALTGTPAPAVLSFVGLPFAYDPTAGNLLLDIQITGISHLPVVDTAAYDARNGTAGGIFSRAHNFDSSFENWGLVTEFVGAAAVPEPATLFLLGSGLAGLAAWRRRQS